MSLIFECSAQQWIGPNNPIASIRRQGNVGIGAPALPLQKLHLRNGNMLLDIGNLGTTGNVYFGGITNSSQSGMRLSYQNTNDAYIDVRTPGVNQGLIFRVDNTTGATERMRIAANGNVGINQPTPTFHLHVQGDGHFTDRLEVQGNVPFSPGKLSVLSQDNIGSAISAWSVNSLGAYIEGKATGLFGNAGVHTSGGTNPTQAIGLWGKGGSLATVRSVGVHGDGMGSQYAIGLWGQAIGGSISNYGVWGDLPFGNGYAGYFSGDVYSTGTYLPSDSRLKSGLKPFNGALANLKKINIYQFNFKSDEFPSLRLPTSRQIGLIAEEIETIFPEFIKQTVQPSQIDSTGSILEEAIQFKSVNYEAMIPVLIQAIKEQQTEIEALRREVEELKLIKNKRKTRKNKNQ